MIYSTITQNKLTLSVDNYELPTQNSNNIQLKFVQDTENYQGYIPTAAMALLDSSLVSCAEILNEGGFVPLESDGTFLIQNNILSQDGFLAIAINLSKTANEITENVMLPPVVYKIKANIGAFNPLPSDDDLWQSVVTAFVEQLYNQDYKPQFDQIQQDLENLVDEAQKQQDKANQQQTQIDNAINVMGDYEVVSEDPTQIRFKKGNGEYGDTVDLGDGLASKSMVNAGYYQSVGSQYSGSASDYGIEVARIEGAYKQDGTPTPEKPIEPKFFHATSFNTNSGNLFDQSKLSTMSANGALVTNNGDGSFTITGSGILTPGNFEKVYIYSNEETKKILKTGIVKKNKYANTNPQFMFGLVPKDSGNFIENKSLRDSVDQFEVTEEDLKESRLKIVFYGSANQTIVPNTIKPVVYQDGDGTFYPFNVSSTPSDIIVPALPGDVKSVYENGVLTKKVGYIKFDGSDD